MCTMLYLSSIKGVIYNIIYQRKTIYGRRQSTSRAALEGSTVRHIFSGAVIFVCYVSWYLAAQALGARRFTSLKVVQHKKIEDDYFVGIVYDRLGRQKEVRVPNGGLQYNGETEHRKIIISNVYSQHDYKYSIQRV